MAHKKYIAELDELTATLERKPQIVGFIPRFFVPGWIGFIQECIVESKMSKAAKHPIHNGLNYYECCEQVMQLTAKACEARKNDSSFTDKDIHNPDNFEIFVSANKALEAWFNIYPEIASVRNIKVSERYSSCMYNIAKDEIEKSLQTIIEIPKESPSVNTKNYSKAKRRSSFGRDMKAMGGQFAAMFCNILVFAAIALLIGAIFG